MRDTIEDFRKMVAALAEKNLKKVAEEDKGLCTPETEIGKSPPETGARNPPRKSRNARNCGPETGAPQPNLRECRRFSPTGNSARRRLAARRGFELRTTT